MNGLKDFRDKSICVLGCGKTGISAITALKGVNANVLVYDDNLEAVERICNEYSVKRFEFELVDAVLSSPGIRKHKVLDFARANNIRITSDIEILQNTYTNAKYIGITGTNGKSTTTKLVGDILTRYSNSKVAVCGNIGIPVLSLEPADVYVIELSSYQLDLLQDFHLDIAVCLNITPDHLNSYENMNEYAASKARIFKNADVKITSIDYELCEKMVKHDYLTISREKNANIFLINNILTIHSCLGIHENMSYIIPYNQSLAGKYNAENVAAAVAVCLSCGIDIQDVINGIDDFKGLPHRMEVILKNEIDNVTFINDSKATNCSSTKAAFDSVKNSRVIWIAGGIYKDDALETLSEFFHIIDTAYLVGDSMNEFHDVLQRYGVKTVCSQTIENALHSLKDLKNCVVLLSPACASTDQWKNFEERGEFFSQKVKELFSNRK